MAILAAVSTNALAGTTGTWTPTGTGGSATAAGVTVTATSSLIAATPTAATLNSTGGSGAYWTNPYGAAPTSATPALAFAFTPFGTTGTFTLTFSKPVDNPVIHFARIGGATGGTSDSSSWTLGTVSASSSVTLSVLASANSQFSFSGSTFQRTPAVTAGGSPCVSADATSTACGSVQLNGTGITSVTFNISWVGPSNGTTGDGIDLALSIPDTKAVYKKQSVAGTGNFAFTGTNGVGASSLNTATTNPQTSATYTVTDNSQPITFTETPLAGYALTGASCVDQTATAVTSSLAGNVLTIAAANYKGGGQAITCTFTNTKLPTVTLTKISNGGVGGFTFTGNNGWSSQTITTVTSGTGVAGATQTLTAASTATTITEAIPAGYAVTAITCSGLGTGGTATPNLGAGSVALDAAATAAGSNIACTFTNAKLPTVKLTKISNGGVGTFTFTGTNGWTSQNITTTTAGTGVTGATQTLTAPATATTITETIPSGYSVTAITCSGLGTGGTATPNLATGAVALDAAAAAAGSNIACTFTNGTADMSISLAGLPTSASIGVAYSGTFTCTNAAAPALAATAATCAVAGLPAGLTTSCSPTPPTSVAASATITCTVTGTPTTVGSSTLTGTTGATNDPNTANNSATATIAVTGSDMTPDLSGLPATATVGTAYSGTILCTNNATATASAAAATCAVSGLPPGVTVGTCTPTPPATVAAGASISCPVSGTPTASGSSTVSVTTGATNDSNGGATSGGNNTATKAVATSGSDMSISLAGLPATASIGVAYSGTFTCSNAASPAVTATAATCAVAGLPAGLTTSCSPTPPTSVAASATITCTVTGTPTTVGSSTLTGTTGATNDPNTANNSATATIAVTGSDMTPDLSGLPATATVGVAYSGIILCTNNATATASAAAATCAVSGLPPGVTVGTCTPTPPATVAAGASISCPVSGTPTASGSSTVSVTTGATNDVNGGATSGGNNSATKAVATSGSDMSISLSGLPATASIGVAYSGTFTCSNAASPAVTATAATCAVSGLPAGLTTSCSPTPPTSVAASATITCTVTGTPTTVGSSTLTGSTGATNDPNVANNSATATIAVTGSDMTPDLSGLPATATVGVAYSGTILCTNNATATASAAAATCAVSGLPPGVTVGTCTPTPPATVAAGASISCPVSGTPTASGSSTVSVTTGATNDVNGGATSGGNNTATKAVATSGSDMSISLAGLPATASIGVAYSGTFTCSNAASPAVTATAATCAVAGLPAGLTTSCSPTPPTSVAASATITCTVTGTPTTVGSSTLTGTTGATNDPNTANNSATATIAVTGSDMTPDLSGLPATATVGVAYSGIILCTNNATATASAAAATCAVSGLPPGVTVGTCTPTPPATVAAGASISCPVSGTPTASGSSTVSVTTGATNDVNGGATSGGNNTATKAVATSGSDMSISLAGLPTTGALGQPYSGSFTCTNASSPAIAASAASCSVSGLPAGLTTSCSPTPPTSVAPGATITCSVTGTPTAPGSSTVNGTTGATNDPNAANNTATTSIAIVAPSLSVAKSTTTSSFANVGTVVPYTFVVTNNGTITITQAVTVTDSKIASVSCPALPGGGLTPTSSITCAGSYTTTQADIDAGGVTNTASAKSGTTTSPTASHTLPATQAPALTIAKSTTTTGFASVGTAVPYTFTVTNSGNTTITSAITVSDSKLASVSCPALPGGGLAPLASITCTGSYTTTQADLDAGGVTNTATAKSGSTTSPTASHTLPATQSPAMSVTKSTTTSAFASAGTAIPYSYVVKNTGNTTLTSAIAVTDNKIASVSCPALPSGGLAPGATLTCTGTYTTTQADVDAGSVTNTASATSGPTTSPTTSVTVTATQSPALSVAKTASPTTFSAAGAAITYSYKVTNAGNVTLTSAISVTDNKIATVSCPALPGGGLAPGAFITCSGTYVTTQADVDSGSVSNTASAKSGSTTSPTTSATATATQSPGLTVAKSTTTTSFSSVGTSVPYSFLVTNSGNVTLTSAVTVTDSKIASVTCAALPSGGLAPGATLSCTGSYTTTQADIDAGGVTNTATAKSGTTTSPVASHTLPANQTDALTLTKTPSPTTFSATGVTLTYTYVVRNTGNTTISAARTISVSDNKIASVACPAIPVGGLAPGATLSCTATHTTTQAELDAGSITNTASATDGVSTAPTVSATVTAVQSPALSIVKSTIASTYSSVGTVIPYTFVLTNSGNITLTSAATVTDSKIAAVTCPALPSGGLSPGATLSCTGAYTITQADIDAGSVTNAASAKSGSTTSPTTTHTLSGTQTPALSLAKSSPTSSFAAPGVVISYSYKVTNTGNTTLTSALSVADSRIASVTCPALPSGGLAPGAVLTCTGSYTTTQADVDAGKVTNTASASSGSTSSPTTSLTIPATQSPALTVAKSASASSISTVGQTVTYSYQVTNSGNVTLTNAIAVTDSKIASVTCPALPSGGLSPAASITCTASYTVTQADLDAGGVTNTASAKSGSTTSPTASLTVPATQSPALAVVKSSTTSSFTTAGTVIAYSYKVTNTGNTTLTSALTVSDSKIASVSCPALPSGGLAPAAFITCTGSYTTTQADVDAGGITNTASAKSGATTSPVVSLTITSTQTPALAIAKSTTASTYATVGQTVPYSFVVTNAGNTTLTSAVSVTDSKIGTVTCPALPSGGLVPGATLTCTANYSVTQADIDGGNILNTASAKSGAVTSPTVTYDLKGTQTPKLTIAKSSTTASITTLGQVVSYSYLATNTGNVTLTQAVTIADNKIASVTCPALPSGGLAPTASITCTASYTVTQADLDAGSVVNTATGASGDASTTITSNTTSLTIPVTQTPSLSLVKSAPSSPFAAVGQTVSYSFLVTNSGNVTVTVPVTIADNRISSVTCPALPSGGLAPASSLTCTGTYTVTQADLDSGSVVNTATAKSGPTISSPPQVHTQSGTQTRALTLAKTASPATYASVGQTISYTYVVTNSGNVTVPSSATISVSDNKLASVSCPAVPPSGLAPAATLTCTATHAITQADIDAGSIVNTATATDGTATSPTASATVTATKTPALTLVKSTTATGFAAPGVAVPYTFTATNNGNTTLTSAITVADSRIASVGCPALPSGGLAPGAFITCTGTYTTTQADVDAGSVTNTATATSGPTTSPTASHTLPAAQSRALTLAKSASPATYGAPGITIAYSYVVTNSGNITIPQSAAITVADNKLASVSCPALSSGGLAPGAKITCTASYTTTQADVDTGSITNVATATDGVVTSPSATATVTAVQAPSLSLVKATTASSYASVGQAVPYTFTATNNGNTTLTQAISVTDNRIGTVVCPALPSGGLAPGGVLICTGTYTTTQADIDTGSVVNTAFSKSGTTTSTPPVSHTLSGTQTPSLSLVKSTTATSFAAPGVTLPYSYKVTNTGNTTLTNAITIADNRIASVSCPALPSGGLAPAAFITCTATYTTTQADVDAGKVTNTASAASGPTTSPTVSVTVNATQSPALTLLKSTTAGAFAAPGVTLPFSYKVTNSGNTTLTAAISVTDSKIASVSCPALPSGGLVPGASITCTASYTTTQADVDAGKVTNTASAASGPTTSPAVSVTVNATQSPALSIVKSSTTPSFGAPGITIPYSYKVTNAGNTTLTSAITVADSKIASVSCPALPSGGLAPGAFLTCTASYTTVQADVDAGKITNTASATSGTVVSPTASLTINAVLAPALSVAKTSTTSSFAATGVAIPYSYKVTNTGNTTFATAVTVTDSKIASVTCPALPSGGLVPGAFITCTGSYSTTQADLDAGKITNTASATSGTTTSPVTTLSINATQTPALTVAKSSTASTFAAPGTALVYSYKVTNSGNVTLTSAITIADSKIASVSCPALPSGGLAPAAFITCTATYTTVQADVDAGKVTNTASATSGTTTSPVTTLTINATQAPALTLVKTSTASTFATVGVALPYSYKVTNSGNTTLTSAITVADSKIASVTCPALPSGGLAPGAFLTCTASYTTTQADLDAGKVTNTASATSGTTTSPIATLTINATQAPALSIVKTSTATSFSAPGATLPYTYKVTNTGNTTLTSAITVTDNKIASVTCPALPSGGLAPAAFINCTATYTTTQADVDAGKVVNTASAASGPTTSPATSLTINASQTPALSLVKSSSTTTFSAPGVAIPYSYLVTNTGNTTLSSAVTVADNLIASVTCPALPSGGLAPAASITCTGSYTTTQADVDAGKVTNIASAKSGTVTSPNATLTINATQSASLSVVKSTTATTFAAPGVVLPFTYKVTNTGNTTLTTAITVADNKIPTVVCPALPSGGLAPGASLACTGAYTTTQADVDTGKVTNTATATSGPVTSPTVSVTVTATQSPALTIAKSSTATGYATPGTVIPYSYKVTNSGNTTLTSVITVTDNKIASVTCPALPSGGLAPSASITCTASATITQADIDAGSLTNTASAKSGSIVSAPVSLTLTATQAPALSIVKSSTTTSYASVGTVIAYSYKVTNTGNTTLSSAITVADDKIATVTCPALPAGGLAPAASITCTASAAVKQSDIDAGSLTNTASAKSGPTASPAVSLTIPAVQTPALGLVKATAATGFSTIGDLLPFTYKVTNIGNVTLTSAVSVTDDKIASVTCPALPAGGLSPTASITCTGTYAVTQADLDAGAVTNTASAKSGSVVSPTVSLTVVGTQKPDFTIVKTTLTPTAINNGDGTFTVDFTLAATNVGNVNLKNVQIVDNYAATLPAGAGVTKATVKSVASSTRGPLVTTNSAYTATAASPNVLSGSGETLAVGETVTATLSITFNPGANSSGATFTNTATGTTTFYPGTPIAVSASRASSAPVAFVPNKPLIVAKTTPKSDIAKGELVPYTITITNTGPINRTGLSIVDNIPAGFTYRAGSATIGGVASEPAVNGRQLRWSNATAGTSKPLVVKLMLIAGAGLGQGEFTNQAWVEEAGLVVSNVGTATVRLIGDPTFDCTDIIGKVFEDANANGYPDEGERGVPNVRLATVHGQLITTDSEGRYHIACADIPETARGTNFILKLDTRTLPTGYRVTTENPRVIRITAGKMAKINFGVATLHVARLDLTAGAFEAGGVALVTTWTEKLSQVIEVLKEKRSILRISYRRELAEPSGLAEKRLEVLHSYLTDAWKRAGADYPLSIETEIQTVSAPSAPAKQPGNVAAPRHTKPPN